MSVYFLAVGICFIHYGQFLFCEIKRSKRSKRSFFYFKHFIVNYALNYFLAIYTSLHPPRSFKLTPLALRINHDRTRTTSAYAKLPCHSDAHRGSEKCRLRNVQRSAT